MRNDVGFVLASALALFTACNKADAPSANVAATPAAATPAGATNATSAAGGADIVPTSQGDLAIYPVQHATLMLRWNGKVIVVDPVPQANVGKLPRADMILITDLHQDHMSQSAVNTLKKDHTIILVPPAVEQNLGLADVTVIKNGQSKDLLDGIHVDAVPMYNLTRGPHPGELFHDKGRGNGYVLTLGDKRVYISGDTECTNEMKALTKIDVAFVCMNVPYTMPPSEAAACVKAFAPKIVYPYHYRGSDLDEFKSALADQKNVEVRIRNWYP